MTKPRIDVPHSFVVDVDNRVVIATIAGHVNLQSLLNLAERVYADGRVDPDYDSIIDIQTSDWDLSFEDMHAYTERIAANPKMLKGKVVFVASTNVAYGIARMYQGTHESFPSEMKYESSIEAAMSVIKSPGH